MFPCLLFAQAINSNWIYRNINRENHIRLNFENDFLFGVDKYYTQGFSLDIGAAALRYLPTKQLLLNPPEGHVKYGLIIQNNVYTPNNTEDTLITYGDRPFAANTTLQFYSVSTHPSRRERIASWLTIGVMGKIAGGQLQEKIHSRIPNNSDPIGWKNQIANDVVINYRVQFEKQIVSLHNFVYVNATGVADIGTLITKGSLGLNIILGYFKTPYKIGKKYALSVYGYAHTQVHVIGYDAMLEGGIFSKSVYALSPSSISRFTHDKRYGIVLQLGGLSLECYESLASEEFKGGQNHPWAGVQLGIGF